VTFFTKTRPDAPPGFFAAEAFGLRWLGEAHGVPVPAVHDVTGDRIVLDRIDTVAPTAALAESFGRDLATTHRAGAPSFGLDRDGWIGPLPLANTPAVEWPRWYAAHRLVPYLDDARLSPADRDAVERVVGSVESLAGPPEPPSRIHGDLWTGNVRVHGGRISGLIDPACLQAELTIDWVANQSKRVAAPRGGARGYARDHPDAPRLGLRRWATASGVRLKWRSRRLGTPPRLMTSTSLTKCAVRAPRSSSW